MRLSLTISEINGDFGWKSLIFPTLRVFYAATDGVPFGIGYRCWGQKLNDEATERRKKFDDIFSRVDTINQRDWQTDTGRQERPHLHIVLHSKNWVLLSILWQ